MRVCPEIEMIPAIHGRELFAREVRRLCSEQKFDCVAVDIPSIFQGELGEAVDGLPLISALLARDPVADDPVWYYVPTDPCDPMIEGVRQARQRRVPFYCVGRPKPYGRTPMPPMPDEYSIEKLGFEAYASICLAAVAKMPLKRKELRDAKHIGGELEKLRLRHRNILAITRVSLFEHVRKNIAPEEYCVDDSINKKTSVDENRYSIITRHINPDHLYFALSELPFIAAKSQMERHDPFAAPMDLTEAIKGLFTETRDNYFDDKEQAARLSPVRIQAALTYLRNLTVMDGRLIPSLFDIVEAAKGVGGNAYAVRILKNAKYYPFLPIESGDSVVNIGIDRITLVESDAPDAEREVYDAVNLFRDTEVFWRTISIKPDPSMDQKKKYRYTWSNRNGLYSHLPEDVRLESFNAHARGKALRVVTEHLARTEKFTSRVLDGIDIRETLRNWHTGSVYVKELPPVSGKVDTVIIIFDEDHDDNYPQRATWYAEHESESTLSFYATEVFGDLIGPGIARCTYGGVALLFPPRTIPDIFEMTARMGIEGCATRLVAGSVVHSMEKNVAYVAAKAPSQRLRALSRQFKKHLVWIPISAFSNETLNKLRHFHVLNGRDVRSWASRFIAGDE